MPTLKKLLSRFSRKERVILETLIEKILSSDWHGLDIKKLQGFSDIFRLRKGKLRIVFCKQKSAVTIISMERRNEKTYKL